jgi:hypothetical protein
MRRISPILVVFLFISFSIGCAAPQRAGGDDYDVLGSAVSTSSFAMIGEYGASIPDSLTVKDFLAVSQKNIPENYFNVLKKYRLDVKPMGSYYLLLVYAPDTNTLILFDYSCTPKPDGMVLREPGKYDISNLDLYNPCKDKR